MSETTSPRVGLIGLGAMGRGMASAVRAAGFDLGVVDARAGVAEFAAGGGTAYASAAALAAEVDVLISVVVNAGQVEQVLFGDGGAAAALRPGSVFVIARRSPPSGRWPWRSGSQSAACSTSTLPSREARSRRRRGS